MAKARYWLSRGLFLRGLGLVYAVAFLSLAAQARGLFGTRGLLPIGAFLTLQRDAAGALAPLRLPSLFWLDASDGMLLAVALCGLAAGVALVLGCASVVATFVAWLCYLSFVTTGQVFTAHPCDLLLLEAGFLALLSSPSLAVAPRFAPPLPVVFLFRWLLFRVLVGAGIGRLHGDPCWGSLTCLPDYLETESSPTSIALLVHALPMPLHRVLGFVALFAELVVPLGYFGPRRVRHVAGAVTIVVSVASLLTTNDGFSSLLVVVLSVWCFDDALVEKLPFVREWLGDSDESPGRRTLLGLQVTAAALVVASLLEMPRTFSPAFGDRPSLEPFHLVNVYGVVEPVERTRSEIVFEGTWDDVAREPAHWLEYGLPCAPGDPMRAPCAPSPYLRRLDSRLREASLGDFRREPWVIRVVDDLLRENPAVLGLFSKDPFAGKPPRFVRAERYVYRFARSGEPGYWHRELVEDYVRPFSLKDPALFEFLFRKGWLRK
ncbi:MAG TPA: lipase maturation factor family protein [Polyangiaceae bacterium]|jgi:hypothetical protein|nr:lipase maturation factor family protein [Polyangiaceae bacterium]